MSETVTPLAQQPAAPAGWPRAAVTAVFFAHGLLFASWTAHIPHVKAHLRLGDGALGIALLGAPAGSVLAMLAAAYFLPRFGSRRVIRVALAGYCAAGPIVGLTGSFAMLFAALTVWGAFQGILDVSMNTQAISVERLARRPLMPGFHGLWSIGSFAGAALGALGIAIGLQLTDQLLILAVPCLLVVGWLTMRMIPEAPAAAGAPAGGTQPGRGSVFQVAILVLGGIAFADMLCEGAAADWAAVLPAQLAAHSGSDRRSRLRRVLPGHGGCPAVRQPAPRAIHGPADAPRPLGNRHRRIRRGSGRGQHGEHAHRLCLPRGRAGFGHPGRLSVRRAAYAASTPARPSP